MIVVIGAACVQRYALAQSHQVQPLTQYIQKVWTNKDGLPQNSGRTLLQTTDGFLWIGTQDGLVRFDGASFYIYDKENTSALKHNDITKLIETRDSTLWIGSYNGLTSLKKGIFTYFPTNTSGEPDVVRALLEDHNGSLWIATMNAGIRKYTKENIEIITKAQGLTSNSIYALAEDKSGNIWIGTDAGVNVYKQGHWVYYHVQDGLPHEAIRCICVTSDSCVWIGTYNGLVRWRHGAFRTYTTADGLSDNTIRTIYEDHTGEIWIGTERGGVSQYNHGAFIPFRSAEGLSGDFVSAILEDREENIWIGTYNAGLNQFSKSTFFNYTVRDGLPNDFVASVIQSRNGDIWIGSGGSGVFRFDGKKFIAFTSKNGLQSNSIRSLFEDSQGTIWIGTVGGLAQYKQGQIRVFSEKNGISQSYIRAIGEDHQKHVWVGSTSSGVFRLEADRFVSYKERGIPAAVIRSILVDHEGAVWIGSNEAVRRWKDDTVTTYTQKDGLPADPIYVIMEDSAHTLWMGSYGGGLVRWKQGIITRITQAQGLYNDVVFHLLEDNNGLIWMSSLRGISSVSRKMLNDFADGKIDRIQCNSYTSSDGMVNSECTGNAQSGGYKTSDGLLWFGTTGGIVVVDPKRLQKNILPPPVVIERIVVDRKDYSPYNYGRFAPGKGQVEFHYGGLSYISPQKVNFRYTLEGFEKDWRFAGTRHGAYYTNLAPGKYIFSVTACNSDGVWNETGASFAFELEPHFYESRWFYGLVIMFVGGAGFGMYRLRVWRLLKREKELTIRVNEATAKIKTLNGLIPICANCKKIRNDKGYWDQLEGYIQTHSEASFTHGICPECAQQLYGEYYSPMNNQGKDTVSQSPMPDLPKE